MSGCRRIAILALLVPCFLLGCPDPEGVSGRTGTAEKSAPPHGQDASLQGGAAWCGPASERNRDHPLVVIGVDGATWDVVDQMLASGELPHFQKLLDSGVRARIVNLQPLVSPVVWTTYATGTFPRQHNILDFTFPYSAGEKAPVESTLRRSPAIWNIASECDRSVGIVGYFVTEPAERVNGFMISDTLLAGLAGTANPPELSLELALIDTDESRQAAYQRFFPWGYNPDRRKDPAHPHFEAANLIFGRLDGAIIRDANVRAAALQHIPLEVDLFMTYFRVVDHASHSTWRQYDSEDFDGPTDPKQVELLGDVIPEAYRYIDDFIGEILPQLSRETNILVISDHGFGSATGAFAISHPVLKDRLSGNHRFDGFLLGSGPNFRQGTSDAVSAMDIAPLMLKLLELPISAQMPGRVPIDLLSRSESRTPKLPRVDHYDIEPSFVPNLPPDLESQRVAIESLQALGYLDPDTKVGTGDAPVAADFWEAEIAVRRPNLRGEGLFYLQRDKMDSLAQLMNETRERDPELAKTLAAEIVHDARLAEPEFGKPLFRPGVLDRFLGRYSADSWRLGEPLP